MPLVFAALSGRIQAYLPAQKLLCFRKQDTDEYVHTEKHNTGSDMRFLLLLLLVLLFLLLLPWVVRAHHTACLQPMQHSYHMPEEGLCQERPLLAQKHQKHQNLACNGLSYLEDG